MRTVKPGIREKSNGRYIATKSVNGKRHYQEFDTLREAQKWKNEFHPLLSPVVSQNRFIPTASDQSNGKNKSINFGEVLDKYRKGFLPSLESYTQYKKEQRLAKFTKNILGVPMCVFTPETITNFLNVEKLNVAKDSRRCNFEKELKDLSSVFNWYRTIDFTFVNPVNKVHFKLGKIKDVPVKKKDMDMEEFVEFVSHLRPMFRSMAILMLLWAARVGEAAAIMDETISLKRKEVYLFNVVVWIRGRPALKKGTKTGADAVFKLTEMALYELRKLERNRPEGCKFFFHNKGKPLRYGLILNEFNRALEKAKLPYTGTHVIRHTMATITRKNHGLDAAQAILRHTTARMSEEYARLDVNEKVSNVVIQAEEMFRSAASKSLNRATICDQEAVSN